MAHELQAQLEAEHKQFEELKQTSVLEFEEKKVIFLFSQLNINLCEFFCDLLGQVTQSYAKRHGTNERAQKEPRERHGIAQELHRVVQKETQLLKNRHSIFL